MASTKMGTFYLPNLSEILFTSKLTLLCYGIRYSWNYNDYLNDIQQFIDLKRIDKQ